MSEKSKEVLNKMEDSGLVPVFNHPDSQVSKKVLDAAYASGIRVFEFTNRESNALEVFEDLAKHAAQYEGFHLGIGTIFTSSEARRFMDVGADFIVSPAFIPEVIQTCQDQNVLAIPGCATVTEVFHAKKSGAHLIKAFPGNLLGPAFIKAVLSVIPDVIIMPTGGVEPTFDNLKGWFDAGVHCVGMGSQLFDKKVIQAQDYEALQQSILKALQLVEKVKA
ncbi:bifunctional 4-hydroxy-2-oxoglutarate aldolase/2-dehydro-3-deoxy-phosphogluconate aldolase [Litoribacter alkaliphilus]|uniref:Bifunctional 4-hydroxy-2-oxoglutarate aldolase/2-dehydro-3-deoxy-phosphogluconate aldolase n=1 Tax=Litoribacter ruber TaxID=702568 RepID=A0AAP2G2W9_9BACT|nr:bifunctional 4-hydroxy-2-oxoglutarate aldolase/2-dehydro-3-deoxy-phosphogluconate aldolase [Litoribacter alkaliphilus]MBS9522785.1 bifunctional 4-hydroxy-2-oxoglutarate aldolase/2-dehydro-3-deoxy-phosphogluconate aldolase [Litoribacter alkaliphilus]